MTYAPTYLGRAFVTKFSSHQRSPHPSPRTTVSKSKMPAWGDEEKKQWVSQQVIKRSYAEDVLPTIDACRDRFDVEQYASLHYGDKTYPLFAIKTRNFDGNKKTVLVTGGVHGYETSGMLNYPYLKSIKITLYRRQGCACFCQHTGYGICCAF